MASLPSTVEEAVDRLMMILDDEQRISIAVMEEDELIDLHFSLGIVIRNAFGLHDQDSQRLKSLGYFVHPDDASMSIIHALSKELAN